VAVKVRRPGIRQVVEDDAALLRALAAWAESVPGPDGGKLIRTDLVDAVEEFFARLVEELDYRREAENAAEFGALYGATGTVEKPAGGYVRVVVPEILKEYSTENVLVMEWLEGTKLTDVRPSGDERPDPFLAEENLALVKVAIDATLCQLFLVGVLHADPHAGNLLKIRRNDEVALGYLDFGMVSTVPPSVRSGLVCSVAQLVFARDVGAVAALFGELDLLPESVLLDDAERSALETALRRVLDRALVYPPPDATGDTPVPVLKFDKLLDGAFPRRPRPLQPPPSQPCPVSSPGSASASPPTSSTTRAPSAPSRASPSPSIPPSTSSRSSIPTPSTSSCGTPLAPPSWTTPSRACFAPTARSTGVSCAGFSAIPPSSPGLKSGGSPSTCSGPEGGGSCSGGSWRRS